MFSLAGKQNVGKSQARRRLQSATPLPIAPEVTTPAESDQRFPVLLFPSLKTMCKSFHSASGIKAATH
jgi:hypothetical protein